MIDWKNLDSIDQLESLLNKPQQNYFVVFKHSTRCGISSMALRKFEKDFKSIDVDFYYLDLLKHRNISNLIAENLKVEHQSPQMLLIKNKNAEMVLNHHEIDFNHLVDFLKKN